VHRHSGNRRWRESAAHSDPGHRTTVPSHLRPRSRGCENTCYHATKENEFSPVHSVIGFQRLKPPDSKVAALEKIKGNERVTNAPPLGRLRQSVKLPSTYNSLNSPACSCVSITLPRFKTSRSQFHCVWLAVPKPTEFVITGTEFRPLKSLAVRRYPLPGQGRAFGDNQGSDALIASCAVAQKRGMIGLKTSRSSLYNHTREFDPRQWHLFHFGEKFSISVSCSTSNVASTFIQLGFWDIWHEC